MKAQNGRSRTGMIVAALATASALGLMHKRRGRKPGLLARLIDGAAMAVAAREVLVPAFTRVRSRMTWPQRAH